MTRPRKFTERLLLVWISVALIYFLWESSRYLGLFGWAAEWQISVFGYYKPALTILFLALLFTLPILILHFVVSLKKEKQETISPGVEVNVARRYLKLFNVCGAVFTLCALVSAAWTLLLPGRTAEVHRITIGKPSSVKPPEGSAILIGGLTDDKVVRFDQDYLLADRRTRYIALRDPGRRNQTRYFVELGPEDPYDLWRGGTRHAPRQGILVRNSLPGAIREAYAHLGYRITPDHYLLHRGEASIRRPYLLSAVEFAVAGLAFWIVAYLQSRRIERLRKKIEQGKLAVNS